MYTSYNILLHKLHALFTYLPIHLFTYLPIYLFIYLLILFTHLRHVHRLVISFPSEF